MKVSKERGYEKCCVCVCVVGVEGIYLSDPTPYDRLTQTGLQTVTREDKQKDTFFTNCGTLSERVVAIILSLA